MATDTTSSNTPTCNNIDILYYNSNIRFTNGDGKPINADNLNRIEDALRAILGTVEKTSSGGEETTPGYLEELKNVLATEIEQRVEKDTELSSAIGKEKTDREAAITNLEISLMAGTYDLYGGDASNLHESPSNS